MQNTPWEKKRKLKQKQGVSPSAQNISAPPNFATVEATGPLLLLDHPGVESIVVARSVSAALRLIQTSVVTLASVDNL